MVSLYTSDSDLTVFQGSNDLGVFSLFSSCLLMSVKVRTHMPIFAGSALESAESSVESANSSTFFFYDKPKSQATMLFTCYGAFTTFQSSSGNAAKMCNLLEIGLPNFGISQLFII